MKAVSRGLEASLRSLWRDSEKRLKTAEALIVDEPTMRCTSVIRRFLLLLLPEQTGRPPRGRPDEGKIS
ncbi:MAG: hypothetical protein IPK13_01275 [Deltaproteobacteria bacterium]|nr:hypothetical protein [Deltaproteobacteria bacterium]